jgi:hypothetical protein
MTGKDGKTGVEIPFAYPMSSPSTSYNSGRAPYFDGTHYASWKQKMKMHLKSINPSIWRIVELGYTIENPARPTEEDDSNEHKNAQAVNAIYGALSGDEFNRVAGLESAKDIWITLQNVHEGTSSVRESKLELLKGKLDRFVMGDNESPSDMFNRLSLLVNEIKGLGNKEMTDNFIVKRMLRAITPRNVTLVTLIRERDNFDKLTPHDVLGRILAHDLMQQESKEIYDLNNPSSSSKKQSLALKARQEDEECTSEDGSVDHQAMEEMALFVKKFGKFLKKGGLNKYSGKKKVFGKSRQRHSERTCYECGKAGHFIAECPNKKNKEEGENKGYNKSKYHKKDKGKHHKKSYKGKAHIVHEWDSNASDSDSDEDQGVATIALATPPPKKSLFEDSSDDETPVCLMAKGPKVSPPTKLPKINVDLVSEHDSDSENDMLDDLNELSLPSMCDLLETIEKQEEILEKQEDLLIFEKERNLELENALAKERKKNETLSKMLKLAKASNVDLENSNNSLKEDFDCLDKSFKALKVELEDLKISNSTSSANVISIASTNSTSNICIRCKDVDINAIASNAKSMAKLEKSHECLIDYNNYIEKRYLETKELYEKVVQTLDVDERLCSKCETNSYLDETKLVSENAKLKAQLKFGLLKCHKGSKALKELLSHQVENFNHEGLGFTPKFDDKGKAWLPHRYPKTKFVHAKGKIVEASKFVGHETRKHQLSKAIGGGSFDASYVLRKGKDGNIHAKYVGPRNSGLKKSTIWVPKSLVTNLQGPMKRWVPKSKV